LHEVSSANSSEKDTLLSMDPVANYYHQKYHGQSMNRSKINARERQGSRRLRIVYPTSDRVVFIPKKLDQSTSRVKVSANSTAPDDKVFWYLNDRFHSSTTGVHELDLGLPVGQHELYVVNQAGQEDEVAFEVVKREEG
jgi:membrane carboxypeptidase/penicillin-binding protein PbpC